MIVEYDETGRIFHVMNDPILPKVRQAYAEKEGGVIILDPLPGAPVQARGMDGKLKFSETGEPVMTNGSVTYQKVDIRTDYVVDGVVIRRPDSPATVELNGRTITLSGVPDGSAVTVEIEGERVPVEETVIEIDEPGPITIHIAAPWPYLEARHDLEIK